YGYAESSGVTVPSPLCTFTAGVTTVTPASMTGLAYGMMLVGHGFAPNTWITAVGASTITVNQPPLVSSSALSSAGVLVNFMYGSRGLWQPNQSENGMTDAWLAGACVFAGLGGDWQMRMENGGDWHYAATPHVYAAPFGGAYFHRLEEGSLIALDLDNVG